MMIPILLVISAPKKVKIGIDGDWVLLHFEHLSQYYDMNHTQYHQFHNLIFCIFLCQFPLAWFRIHGLIQTDKYLKVTIAQKTCLQSRFMNPWLHMTPPVPNIFAFTVFVPSTFNLIWSKCCTKNKIIWKFLICHINKLHRLYKYKGLAAEILRRVVGCSSSFYHMEGCLSIHTNLHHIKELEEQSLLKRLLFYIL